MLWVAELRGRHLIYHWGRSSLAPSLLICIKNNSAHSFWGQYFLLFKYSYKKIILSQNKPSCAGHSPYSLLIIVTDQKHHDFSTTKEKPSSTGQSPSGRFRVRVCSTCFWWKSLQPLKTVIIEHFIKCVFFFKDWKVICNEMLAVVVLGDGSEAMRLLSFSFSAFWKKSNNKYMTFASVRRLNVEGHVANGPWFFRSTGLML